MHCLFACYAWPFRCRRVRCLAPRVCFDSIGLGVVRNVISAIYVFRSHLSPSSLAPSLSRLCPLPPPFTRLLPHLLACPCFVPLPAVVARFPSLAFCVTQISTFGFTFCPRGWAACDGQILPINQHQSLYSLLGTTYGGDGRTSKSEERKYGRNVIANVLSSFLTPRLVRYLPALVMIRLRSLRLAGPTRPRGRAL